MNRRQFLLGLGAALGLSEVPIGAAKPDPAEPSRASTSLVDVILTFDGCGDIGKWRKTIDFSKLLGDISQKEANLTYFLCSAYLFSDLKIRSDIGFGGSAQEVKERRALVQEAIDSGHEIACHTVTHLNGKHWHASRWASEILLYDKHIGSLFSDKKGDPYQSIGFRAPYLAVNNQMYVALNEIGYTYDSSKTGEGICRPGDMVSIKIPEYKRNDGRNVIGMDYNWHRAGVGSSELEKMLRHEWSEAILDGKPLIISMHFDNLGTDRMYWDVVKDFLIMKADSSRFVSFQEYGRIKKLF